MRQAVFATMIVTETCTVLYPVQEFRAGS